MKRLVLGKLTRSNCWFLENRDVRVAVEKATGLVRSVYFKRAKVDLMGQLRQNMAGQVGYLRVYDERAGRWYDDLHDRFRITKAVKRGNRITLTKRFAGAAFVLTERLELDETSLVWTVQAVKANGKVLDRSLRVGFNVPLHAGWDVWAPCADGQFTFDGMDSFNFNHLQVSYISPREIILPVVSHYSKDLDVGYSVLLPIPDKVPAARFQFENGQKLFNWGNNLKPVWKAPTLEVLNYYIGLVGDRTMTTRVELVFHEGDWRPGLGKVYRKYRPYFDPDSQAIYDFEGAFHCGGTYVAEDTKHWTALGLKTLEVHGHFKYYGDYYQAGQDRWLRNAVIEGLYRRWRQQGRQADAWEVWDWVHSHSDEEIADELFGPDWRKEDIDLEKALYHRREDIKRDLQTIVKAGICPFWYFNYTDGFRPMAEQRWPDAICRDQAGQPVPSGWQMCHNILADPGTSFGRFCEESARKILAEYPTLVGFFLDCFRHYEIDYAHDDGITVVDNRPAYSVNFSYDWITRRLKELMRATGRPMALFANKPQNLRCMRHVDGQLLEGDGDVYEEKYFWASIAMPNFFMWTSNRHSTDENLRRAVLHGCFPKVGKDPDMTDAEQLALYRKYLPLYEAFRRRVLCFEPDPLRVPRGARGKLYTVPDGYVAGICTPTVDSDTEVKHARTPYALFRVKRGWDVGKVGVMYPGDKTWREVKFKFNGSIIAVPLRRYKNCAVVKLFVTRRTGKRIGPEKFTGPIDFCGDPESSFQDISDR